ncbi:MAG: hypothetical protein AAGE52_24770 [Myxococcota bacterium]
MNKALPLILAAAMVGTLFTTSDASAQAWIREPGSVYTQLSYRIIRADRLYDPDGNRVDIQPFRQHTLGFYSEVGVVDRWLMLTLDGELFRRSVLEDQGAVSGIGDLRVGAWTGLVEVPFRLSFGVVLGLPTGDPNPDAPRDAPASDQTVADVLPTGDGEFDVSFRLAAGHGFGWRKVQQYVLGEFGYALRTTPRDGPGSPGETGGPSPGDIRDQLIWRAETGIRIDRPFIERFWFVLRFSGLVVVQDRNADTSTGTSRFAGLGDGVEYTAVGFETSMRIFPGTNISFGVDGAFAARNIPAAAAYKLGLSYELP